MVKKLKEQKSYLNVWFDDTLDDIKIFIDKIKSQENYTTEEKDFIIGRLESYIKTLKEYAKGDNK